MFFFKEKEKKNFLNSLRDNGYALYDAALGNSKRLHSMYQLLPVRIQYIGTHNLTCGALEPLKRDIDSTERDGHQRKDSQWLAGALAQVPPATVAG